MTGGRDDVRPPGQPVAGVAETTRAELPSRGSDVGPPAIIGTWGGMRLIEELGRGSYGRVYRAWEDTLAREVALKIIPLPRADPDLAKLYLREGQMLARVRHQNVVTVHGALHQGEEIGIWMELVRGRRLADIVRDEGPLGPDEAALVGISLCHALSAVHGAGLLHRDLKAHNVMREEGGRIVLMDFGAGRDASSSPPTGDYSGTPLYMAPEVLAGRDASPASDVYSLGVLLYFLVTGAYPVDGRTAADIAVAHGLGRRVRLVDRRADLPDQFVRVVERATTPLLAARYASAGAMLDALSSAVAGADVLPGGDRHGAIREAVADTRRGRTGTWVLVSVGVVAGVMFLGLLTSAAFDTALGRAGFVTESFAERASYGLRSLIAPAFYVVVVVLLAQLGAGAIGMFMRLLPIVRRAVAVVGGALGRSAIALGLRDARAAAQLVVFLQAVLVVGVAWQFRELLQASTNFVSDGPAALLDALSPENPARKVYRGVLTILVAAMTLVWWKLLTARTERPLERATTIAGVVIIAIAIAMMSVPYRLLFHRVFERVEYDGQRCYVTGQRPRENPPQLLLFCRDATPPRNRIVVVGDSRLERAGSFPEDMFTTAPAAR